ncbi:SWIM zinc finger family protein [Bacteroides sp. 224]|uniref:SWIM zinc finger family protein n=1 Tax=Bacteroides sp. 224 TaxID=2302936 RepID=UPI0013D2A4C0|nr:SWIM zinc finger family protein [Bacteroides sp. 224]NDV67175.1 hypothetical protein [Bacteroides sp. 224]
MDWKNNIVASTDCKALAQPFVAYANESFLVTLANKGLYKRALKDLEAGGKVELIAGDSLQVQLEDVTVTLNENMTQSTCTCPSKTVCKHILMAILAVAEYASSSGTDSEASEALLDKDVSSEPSPVIEPWKELKEADIVSLRKQAGKKLFEDVLRLIQDGWVAEFTQGDMLEAVINTENITVYFPVQDSINRAVCKCGKEGLCKHKLIAILSYLSTQGLINEEENAETSVSLVNAETELLLQTADRFIVDIFDKGIIFCGENEVETAIQYSIRMESAGIGNLARLFRSLSSDLENMLSKHIGFNQVTTFATLSRLHNTMRLILENVGNSQMLSQLIESTRSDYYTTPVGHFTGLGAYPWQTRSGYFGITAYFFYHEKQSICTYTVSLAGYYEQTEELATIENMKRQYMKNDHWGGGFSLASLSQSSFVLRNFKLNKQNRLSSSGQTQCELTGKVGQEQLQELLNTTTLFSMPESIEETYGYFDKRKPDQLVIVPFQDIKETDFSHTEQKLNLTIENEEGEFVTGVVEFSSLYTLAIKYLERIGSRTDKQLRYMVFLKHAVGLMPVCIIGESVNNFFLDPV